CITLHIIIYTMSKQQHQEERQQQKELSAMSPEERTQYSLMRAPDYHGADNNVLANNRAKCWDARDQYFACLDANNENEQTCKQLYDAFAGSCMSSWKEYFIKKRFVDKQKAQMLSSSSQ
ncbi:hypothetical protein SAMD00019534_024860, partial [Acytostelium subglobosum LB1]|uniref:hypothetical protein n=1 Tax=Acytostelium subglobosum LB1 TaxID=1410327 RepID=UPI000644AA95